MRYDKMHILLSFTLLLFEDRINGLIRMMWGMLYIVKLFYRDFVVIALLYFIVSSVSLFFYIYDIVFYCVELN